MEEAGWRRCSGGHNGFWKPPRCQRKKNSGHCRRTQRATIQVSRNTIQAHYGRRNRDTRYVECSWNEPATFGSIATASPLERLMAESQRKYFTCSLAITSSSTRPHRRHHELGPRGRTPSGSLSVSAAPAIPPRRTPRLSFRPLRVKYDIRTALPSSAMPSDHQLQGSGRRIRPPARM